MPAPETVKQEEPLHGLVHSFPAVEQHIDASAVWTSGTEFRTKDREGEQRRGLLQSAQSLRREQHERPRQQAKAKLGQPQIWVSLNDPTKVWTWTLQKQTSQKYRWERKATDPFQWGACSICSCTVGGAQSYPDMTTCFFCHLYILLYLPVMRKKYIRWHLLFSSCNLASHWHLYNHHLNIK